MTTDSEGLESTRRAWHAVAELVLAGPQHRRGGGIRLRAVPGGFATTRQLDLRVIGTELLVPAGGVAISGRSCADLADAAGVDVGEPRDLYHDGSHADPSEILDVDIEAAGELSRAYEMGELALRRLSQTETPVLWPEHFDNAIRVDGVNYGVSPGDGYLGIPYAYVGPDRHGGEAFWNAPFGAVRPIAELRDADAVLTFFLEGQKLAHRAQV